MESQSVRLPAPFHRAQQIRLYLITSYCYLFLCNSFYYLTFFKIIYIYIVIFLILKIF